MGTNTHLDSDDVDGSYIMYHSSPQFFGGIMRDAGYEFDDFAHLGVCHASPQSIILHADAEYETMEDFVESMRDNPGEYAVSLVPASWSEALAVELQEELDLDIRIVPYDGGGEQRSAVISGDVNFTITDVEGTLAAMGEDAKFLAVVDHEPFHVVEDVPILNDAIGTDFPPMVTMRSVMVNQEFKEEYPERFEILADAFEAVFENEDFLAEGRDHETNFKWHGPDEGSQMMRAGFDAMLEYEHIFEED